MNRELIKVTKCVHELYPTCGIVTTKQWPLYNSFCMSSPDWTLRLHSVQTAVTKNRFVIEIQAARISIKTSLVQSVQSTMKLNLLRLQRQENQI